MAGSPLRDLLGDSRLLVGAGFSFGCGDLGGERAGAVACWGCVGVAAAGLGLCGCFSFWTVEVVFSL